MAVQIYEHGAVYFPRTPKKRSVVDIVSYEENEKLAPKKDRYWSVMLVGDRGRVIPFRHFKGIALGVCCLSFFLLVAFIVMSMLYIGQGKKMASLEDQLKEAQLQSSKLRDEKDLYLTKLMMTQKQEKSAARKPKPSEPSKPAEHPPEQAKPSSETGVAVKKTAAPSKPPAPKVDWKADIRKFSVSYDAKRETLNAQFRVYNTSKPKKRLSGRSVVVFKAQDDPPYKWMPVPRVQLANGEPTGTRGQTFRVRNFLTMKFRAYHQKTPITFNTASVFIFSEDGRMLVSKDFAFKIKTPPPPKKKPAPPSPAVEKKPPAPAQAPTADTPAAKASESAAPTVPEPQEGAGSAASNPAPGSGKSDGSGKLDGSGKSDGSGQPDGAPSPPDVPVQAPEASKPSDIADTPPSSAPPAGESDIPVQTDTPPATEPTVQSPQQ
jgi:hypothetical protein